MSLRFRPALCGLLLVLLLAWTRSAPAQTFRVQNGSTLRVQHGTVFTLEGGTMDLGGVGSTARLAEETDGRVADGTLNAVRVLNAPSGVDVAGMGAVLSTAADLGAVTLTRRHTLPTGGATSFVRRSYDIEPTGTNSDLDATLTASYADAELNGLDETTLSLFKSTDGGEGWTEQGADSRDAAANTVTLSGVDAFSRWALGGAPAASPSDSSALHLTNGPDFGGYVSAADSDDLDLGSPFTVEFWIKHDATSDETAYVLNKGTNSSGIRALLLNADTEAPRLRVNVGDVDDSRDGITSDRSIPAGRWTHVAVVDDGTNLSLYLDGQLDDQNDEGGGTGSNGNDLVIGANDARNGNFFSGRIDDLRFWQTARPVFEIQDDYLHPLSGDEPGLVTYYRFDEMEGGSIADVASGGASDDVLTAEGNPNVAIVAPGVFPVPPLVYAQPTDAANTVAWTERGPAETFYLYRGQVPDGSDASIVTTTSDTSFTDDTAGANTTYYYSVATVDTAENRGAQAQRALSTIVASGGSALTLDGADDYAFAADRPELDLGSEFTVEFWFQWDGSGTDNLFLLNKGTGSNGIRAQLQHFPDDGGWFLLFTKGDVDDSRDGIFSSEPVSPGEWIHVAAVSDGTNLSLYLNGTLDNQNTNGGSTGSNSNDLLVGTNDAENANFFPGQIDGVRLWTRTRSATEISSSYQTVLLGNETGLVADWRMNEAGASVARSAAGRPLTAVLQGDAFLGTAARSRPPTATDDIFTATIDQTLSVPPPGVVANDSDPDGDALSVSVVSDVSNGDLSLNSNGSFAYTPNPGFVGTDGFTYEASDGNGGSDTAAVTLNVEPEGDCTLSWSLDVTGTDAAGESATLTLGQGPTASAGLDAACGEAQLPPIPPEGIFDVRFTDAGLPGVTLGEGTLVDARPDDTPTGEPQPTATNAPAVWRMVLQPEAPPLTLTWDADALATALPDETVRLVDGASGGDVINVDMKEVGTVTVENGSPVPSVEVRLNQDLSRSLTLADGWQLLSVPFQANDPSFGAVLPPCESAFLYQSGQGYAAIASDDAIEPGPGFWGNCAGESVTVTGRLAASQTVPVETGWNIIGVLEDTVDVASVATEPAGIVVSPFFGYDDAGPDLGYFEASALQSFQGYWVRANQSGVIDLSGSAGPAAAVQIAAMARPEAPNGLRLILTDAADRTATLHLLPDASPDVVERYALPPRPPGDLFDVRFGTGRAAAALATSDASNADRSHDVDLQGVQFPVTVQLENAAEEQALRLFGAGTGDVSLTADAPTVTLDRRTARLHVAPASLPKAFALDKSYPNPATQATTISYAVPDASDVAIVLYDVLGRRVARLVDDTKRAGRHRVHVEAERLPSGTYFVRMHAGTFTKTRRLTVVR